MNIKNANAIRITAIVFMGLTAAMNLLGGAGTVCAAFLTKQYPPMFVFYDYQLLYQTLMITTILTGIWGVWMVRKLIQGGTTVYRSTMIVLIVGTILGGIQMFASLAIRGKAVPANMKFYANVFTLVVFLLLKIPGISEYIDFSKPLKKIEQAASGGLSAFVAGIVTLTTFIWVGPSHTYLGNSWVEEYEIQIVISGVLLILGSLFALLWGLKQMLPAKTPELIPDS